MTLALRVENLRKDYVLKGETVHALRDVTFQVELGEYIAVMGPSGSGKSTLLNLLGCLDRPTAGSYFLGGRDVARLNDNSLSDVRAANIGFVFQSYNLIPQLTVVENIEVPLYYQGRLNAANRRRCRDLACTTAPRSCPAASSSAWRSPAAWPTIRTLFWPTSRPGIWTRRPATRCWTCFSDSTNRARRSSW